MEEMSESKRPQIFISGYGSSSLNPNGFPDVGSFDFKAWLNSQVKSLTNTGIEKLPVSASVPSFTEAMTGDVHSLDLPIGVVSVFGRTGSGKSELINYMSRVLEVPIVRFYEPELPVILNPHEVIRQLEDFLLSDQNVFLLDSLRFWIFRDQTRSSALKGGMNSGLFIDITGLSALAAYYGKTIVAVINPMSDDDSVITTMAHNLEGSCAGVIQSRSYGEISFVARTESNNRKRVSYTFNPAAGVEPIKSGEGMKMEMEYGGEKTPDAVARWNRVITRKGINNVE